MSANKPGRGRANRRQPPHTLVRLVTRLVVAQAGAAAAVGLLFSRRLPSALITLALVATLVLLALLVRSGARMAWLIALGFESVFFVYGLSRFVYSRYVGGTLFAFMITGVLLHPAVARAYSAVRGKAAGDIGLGETGERAAG